jgi:hypothetical protein
MDRAHMRPGATDEVVPHHLWSMAVLVADEDALVASGCKFGSML